MTGFLLMISLLAAVPGYPAAAMPAAVRGSLRQDTVRTVMQDSSAVVPAPVIDSVATFPADSSVFTVPETVASDEPADSSSVAPPLSETGSDGPDEFYDRQADSLLARADSLRLMYEFAEAAGLCREAMEIARDSMKILEAEDVCILCENGANLTEFVYFPVVVARKRLSVNDFHLYFPLKDKGWHPIANQEDSLKYDGFPGVFYAPGDSADISAFDPEKAYQVISPDGKTMYFSSAGLYGMGGYDIYVCRRDEDTGSWGEPVNLGLPYSSPYDDFLYADSEDGRFTVFASNRDCPADSVNVYVLEFDSMPVKTAAESTEQVRELMRLEPQARTSAARTEEEPSDSMPKSEDTERYSAKMAEVRALRDSIYFCNKELDEERSLFATSDDVDERARLTSRILRKEASLPVLNEALEKAAAELQKIEMEFLFSGIAIDPDKIGREPDEETVEIPEFEFVRNNPGDTLYIKTAAPEDDFDYSFMILPEGRFAPVNDIPDGVIYTIEMFNISRRATVSQLKGISPVYERITDTGRYNYSAGMFTDYSEASAALAAVKAAGFRNAYITAFSDGQPVSVAKAREIQKRQQ